MKTLRLTLVSEGTTDAALLPIIAWCLKQAVGLTVSESRRAEFWRLPEKPNGLVDEMANAVELYPCDVLFVHRDSDRELHETRIGQIRKAFLELEAKGKKLPAVAVVPVRMLEAWLCFDERAIRKAAGNPNGREPLNLPPLKRVESCPTPKDDLVKALRIASGLSGRRLKKFDEATAFARIVDYIEDFSPLRGLRSFQALEDAIKALNEERWRPGFYG